MDLFFKSIIVYRFVLRVNNNISFLNVDLIENKEKQNKLRKSNLMIFCLQNLKFERMFTERKASDDSKTRHYEQQFELIFGFLCTLVLRRRSRYIFVIIA